MKLTKEDKERRRQQAIALGHSMKGVPKSPEHAAKLREICLVKALEARRNKAPHMLSNVDEEKLAATCKTCGQVPIKVWNHSTKRFLCWMEKQKIKVAHPDQALEMWDAQQMKCAVCKEPMVRGESHDQETVVADHDHKTGLLRGFVHHRCNRMLGAALDDPTKLRQAADYLDPPNPA